MNLDTAFCELIEAAQKITTVSLRLRQLPIDKSIGDYEASRAIATLGEASVACYEIARTISDNSNKIKENEALKIV
mgnify:CR=1 FL=1